MIETNFLRFFIEGLYIHKRYWLPSEFLNYADIKIYQAFIFTVNFIQPKNECSFWKLEDDFCNDFILRLLIKNNTLCNVDSVPVGVTQCPTLSQ